MVTLDFSFISVILTIFLMIGFGVFIKKVFDIDIKTLSKLQFYLLMPSMLFIKIYESELSGGVIKSIVVFTALVIVLLSMISWAIAKFRGYSQSETSVFINTSTYFNSGNYSLPLMQLLFNNPLAVSIQVIILMINNIMFFTIGVFTTGTGKRGPKRALMYVLRMPLLYIMILAMIMRATGIKIVAPVWDALNILSNSYIGVALLTLGAQLSQTKFKLSNKRLYLSNFIRLVVSPLIGFLLVYLLGIHGMVARVLVIAMGAPTAVNVVISSIELENEPDFAAQAVFTSTLLSLITISIVILAVFKFIPI